MRRENIILMGPGVFAKWENNDNHITFFERNNPISFVLYPKEVSTSSVC